MRKFFADNGIDADVDATLDICEGKEDALMKRMQAHLSGDEGELVHGILTSGDILWLEAAFKNYTEESKLDYLTKPEFFDVVAKLSPVPPSDKDLEAAFDIADADDSGGIDLDEFIALFAKVKKGEIEGISDPPLMHDVLTPDDVEVLSKAFDLAVSKDEFPPRDYVTKDEFVKIIISISDDTDTKPRKRDLDTAFVQADVDKSGGIDKEELLLLYSKVRKGEVKGIGGRRFGFFGRRNSR